MPASDLAPSDLRARSLLHRQLLTGALLFAGYAAYYFCRSDLSVSMPLIIQELQRKGMSASQAMVGTGMISSYGIAVYAAGKFLLTGLGDLWGGKRNFVFGLAGAVLFTLLFAASGSLPFFTLAWIGNRISQSGGWAGLIKVCSKWFGYSSYGTVLGILSLSYLIGDAIARQSMGFLIHKGFGWRSLFVYAASVGTVILLCNLFLLSEARTDAGFSEPEVNPLNLFAKSDEKSTSLLGLVSRAAFESWLCYGMPALVSGVPWFAKRSASGRPPIYTRHSISASPARRLRARSSLLLVQSRCS